MGCGASSPATVTQGEAVISGAEPASGLPNGHVSGSTMPTSVVKSQSFKLTSSLKNNTVGPAPLATAADDEVLHEISEVGEILTVKRILKLNSREEAGAEPLGGNRRHVSCQTNKLRFRKRSRDQATQTDLRLFPEDELEDILMTDDASDEPQDHRNDDQDPSWSDKLQGSEDDDESSDSEFTPCRRSVAVMINVSTQSASWTRSTSTQTRLSLTAIAARRRFASISSSSSGAAFHGEGHRYQAKNSRFTTHATCHSVAEAPEVFSSVSESDMALPIPTGLSREASVQTDAQVREARRSAEERRNRSEHVPPIRPPATRKKEMIPSLSIFRDIDVRVNETPDREWESPAALAHYLCRDVSNELFGVRAIFVWISLNIRYELRHKGKAMTPLQVLLEREGVDSHYCCLFEELCRHQGYAVTTIRGFVKGHEYRPGFEFICGEDETHEWNAVHVLGSWRLIDTAHGAGFIDPSGSFIRRFNEHFFLPDPEVLIWTHFPFSQDSDQPSSWQLMDKPISLQEFNALPRVVPQFFEYNMQIRSKQPHPYEFRVQTEVRIGAHEPMRYKYKLFPADQAENESLNHFAFCQLKENRLVGSFTVTPPLEARYFLKVYARAEREILDGTDSSSLPLVATFLLLCTRARKYLEPYPLNELPWGPTQAFYDFKMRILNQNGPVISTWGGKRKLVIETAELMLIQHQMLDADGMEMDIRTYILKEENGQKVTFTIAPPRASKFKFLLFGMPKPRQKGHWRLPLLATFLVDCKLAKIAQKDTDPPPVPVGSMPDAQFAQRKISRSSLSQ